MSEMKWTVQTPEIYEYADWGKIVDESGAVLLSANIEYLSTEKERKEARRNGFAQPGRVGEVIRIAAAAPELYVELEKLWEGMKGHHSPKLLREQYPNVESVLAKARGES